MKRMTSIKTPKWAMRDLFYLCKIAVEAGLSDSQLDKMWSVVKCTNEAFNRDTFVQQVKYLVKEAERLRVKEQKKKEKLLAAQIDADTVRTYQQAVMEAPLPVISPRILGTPSRRLLADWMVPPERRQAEVEEVPQNTEVIQIEDPNSEAGFRIAVRDRSVNEGAAMTNPYTTIRLRRG